MVADGRQDAAWVSLIESGDRSDRSGGWRRWCGLGTVCVQKAGSREVGVSRNAGVPQARSLTNTAPIGYLSTPSSAMQAKRAPGGFRTKRIRGTRIVRWKWVLKRDPEACNKATDARASVGQWIDYEAIYSHTGRYVPQLPLSVTL